MTTAASILDAVIFLTYFDIMMLICMSYLLHTEHFL